MSTILDALRRVESDRRRRADTEQAHSNVVGPGAGLVRPARRLGPWGWGAAVGGLALALAGAAVWSGLGPGADGAASVTGTASVAAPAPTSAALTTPEREADAGTRSAPAVVRAPRPEAAVPPARPVRPVARPAQAIAPAPTRSVPPAATEEARAAAAPAGTAVTPIAALPEVRRAPARDVASPRPRAATEVAASAPPPVQVAAQRLPQTAADPVRPAPRPPIEPPTSSDAVPDDIATTVDRAVQVTVLRTIWHPSADRRVAQLRFEGDPASRDVREGDIVDGYEIVEIKLSGVVFAREGVTLERRVAAKRER